MKCCLFRESRQSTWTCSSAPVDLLSWVTEAAPVEPWRIIATAWAECLQTVKPRDGESKLNQRSHVYQPNSSLMAHICRFKRGERGKGSSADECRFFLEGADSLGLAPRFHFVTVFGWKRFASPVQTDRISSGQMDQLFSCSDLQMLLSVAWLLMEVSFYKYGVAPHK